MNICILSMQRVYNYGSLLQAYSLKKILIQLGHNVDFIDIEPNSSENKFNNVMHFNESDKYSHKGPIYRFLQQDDNCIYSLKKIINKKKVINKQFEFMQNVLHLSQDNNIKHYDLCVIGSDEVFNCMNDTLWGFTSQLFGNVKQADKVITYAASCGFTSIEKLDKNILIHINNAFKNISSFSVRDRNTQDFVYSITNHKPNICLDPVLIGNFDEEISKCNVRLPKRYCIVYAYHGRINSKEEINSIKEICKDMNLEIVSIGGIQKWIHKHLALSPFEVLYAFKNASLVLTDTFHGTIFSAKYASRFAILVRPSNQNKLSDLIDRLELNEHRLDSLDALSNISLIEHDKVFFNKLIQNERKLAIDYLRSSI